MQDARRHGHQAVVERLLREGATAGLGLNVESLKNHPQLLSNIQKMLSVVCTKEGFGYAVAWLDKAGINCFYPSSIWYATPKYVNSLSALAKLHKGESKRRSSKAETAEKEPDSAKNRLESLVLDQVVPSRKAVWVEDIVSEEIALSDGKKLKSALLVPVVCCLL